MQLQLKHWTLEAFMMLAGGEDPWALWPEKNAKCLQKLPKNDFTRKKIDFNIFTKIAQDFGRFGQIAKGFKKLPKKQ